MKKPEAQNGSEEARMTGEVTRGSVPSTDASEALTTESTDGAAPIGALGGDEQHGTRHRVARSILDHGPSTAAELAGRLTLTQAAVRRHLDALTGEGIVEARQQRVYGARARGRPARVFALTDAGRDAFDQAYDSLAVEALEWIARSAGGGAEGAAAVLAFARARADALGERYGAALDAVPPEQRAQALAGELTRDGYAAAARRSPAAPGEQLCQHHCPVAHVAERFPQLCEAETELFSRLLDTHVQRLATIAHGDGVCTTFVPRGAPPPSGTVPPGGPAPHDSGKKRAAPGAHPPGVGGSGRAAAPRPGGAGRQHPRTTP